MPWTMEFDDATSAATRILRQRPTKVLPAFLAESALAVLVQLTLVTAGGLSLLALRGTERLDRVTTTATDLGADPTEADVEAFLDAVADLFTPTILAIVAVAGLVALVVALLVRAVAGAAKVHTAWAAMTDGDPTTAAAADTWAFVRLTLLQVVLFFGLPVSAIAVGAAVGGGGGVALIFGALVLWIPLAIATYFLLLFVPEAIVVEGVGVREGIRRNLSLVRAEPGRAVLFGVLEVGMLFAAGAAGSVFGLVGVGRLTGLLTLLVVFPFVGLVKMGLYVDPGTHPEVPGVSRRGPTTEGTGGGRFSSGPSIGDAGWEPGDDSGDEREREQGDERGRDHEREPDSGRDSQPRPTRGSGIPKPGPKAEPSAPVEGHSYVEDLKAVFGTGLSKMQSFAGEQVGLVGVSLLAFLLGVVGGYQLVAATGVDLVSNAPARGGFGAFPLDTALNLTANNWQVSIGQTYAGILLGIPALGNLVFNGVVVGGIAGLGFDLTVFAALVLPHGLIEVPALAIAGGLGVHLGLEALSFFRGNSSPEAAGEELERAFLALLGLLPLFLVAGLIEAFLTPWIGDVVAGAI
jgi:uncharacterized membrane protein SpoIIM required for sporulation